MAEIKIEKYTKYERARMLGSRTLQIAMGAPFLVKMSKEDLEAIHYDPMAIAKKELDLGVMPLTVRRPFPVSRKQEEKAGANAEEKAAA